jgi:hypothetical protein
MCIWHEGNEPDLLSGCRSSYSLVDHMLQGKESLSENAGADVEMIREVNHAGNISSRRLRASDPFQYKSQLILIYRPFHVALCSVQQCSCLNAGRSAKLAKTRVG